MRLVLLPTRSTNILPLIVSILFVSALHRLPRSDQTRSSPNYLLLLLIATYLSPVSTVSVSLGMFCYPLASSLMRLKSFLILLMLIQFYIVAHEKLFHSEFRISDSYPPLFASTVSSSFPFHIFLIRTSLPIVFACS